MNIEDQASPYSREHLEAMKPSGQGSTPDQLHAIATAVEKQWGYCGYRITQLRPSLWRVRSSDGGEFWLTADRHGAAVWQVIPHDEATPEQLADLAARIGGDR